MLQQTGIAMDERLSSRERLWARSRRWLWAGLAGAVALAALALLAFQSAGDQTVDGADLVIAAARIERVAPEAAFSGRAVPVDQHIVTAQDSAQVAEILVREGEAVQAGQPLLRLSNLERELAVDTGISQIDSELGAMMSQEMALREAAVGDRRKLLEARYDVERLTRSVANQKPLLQRGFVSRQKYEETESELKLKRAFLAEAQQTLADSESLRARQLAAIRQRRAAVEANLQRARARRDAFTVRARSAGIVLGVDVKLGQGVNAGQQLATLDPRLGLEIRATIDQQYLTAIRPGQPARATIGGRARELVVRSVSPRVSEGMFEAVFGIGGGDAAELRAGETVLGQVMLGTPQQRVTLPNGPFLETTAGRWVFLVSPDGRTATRRRIRLGERAAGSVAVLEGLEPGNRAVVSDYSGFADARRLKIQ